MNQLLQNAAYGTAMILLAAALRRVLKGRLDPRARLALWGVCLFRLLTPRPFRSVLSLWGLVGRLEPVEAGAQPLPAFAAPGPAYAPGAGTPIVPATPSAAPAATVNPVPAPFPWGRALAAVWVAVGAVLAVWYLVGWVRARRAVGRAIPVGEDDPRRRLLPRFAQLREGPVEGAPLTFGVVRPQVVLSPGLDEGELACVLAHEGAHARRRDNLWHYAMAAALVAHWWNPAVWLMSRLLRRDIELACDRAALKRLGEDRRAEYAQALVTLSTQGEGNGPAFCQTFGRKATEERIRSIMKFKKPTIIGVVLTLVLVLGVSIAFASDPKAPEGDNIAGTHSLASEPEDGGAGEYSSGSRCSVYYDGSVVTRVVIPLEVLEEDLGIRVEENSISKAEAELIMTQARSIAEDGVIDWTFTKDDGLRHEELPEKSDEHTTVSANGYWDKDGKFVVVNISELVRDFILPQALMGEDAGTLFDRSDYTVVEPEIDEQGNSLVRDEDGNLVIVGIRSTPPMCDDPDCPLAGDDEYYGPHYHDENGVGVRVSVRPTLPLCDDPDCPLAGDDEYYGPHYHDENGVGVRVSAHYQVHYQAPGLLCTEAGCTANGVHEHGGVTYDACAATCTPEQYAAALDAWVALGAMDRQEADEWLEIFRTLYDRVQRGESDAFYYNIYDGTRLSSAFYKSERAAAGYPVNSKGETYGPDMPEVYGSSPDLIAAIGTNGEEGYVRDSELNDTGFPGGVNNPEEALAYMEWLKTQPETRYIPLYDSEGNVIGRFGVSNPEAGKTTDSAPVSVSAACLVCDVEGCTIEGYHGHDGVTYCGGAAHHGATCDGSCIYNQGQQAAGGGAHHQEHHHGGGHH